MHDRVYVAGIGKMNVFSYKKLESYRKDVVILLQMLFPHPKWVTTIADAQWDKAGTDWTDSLEVVEQLFSLGWGLNLVWPVKGIIPDEYPGIRGDLQFQINTTS